MVTFNILMHGPAFWNIFVSLIICTFNNRFCISVRFSEVTWDQLRSFEVIWCPLESIEFMFTIWNILFSFVSIRWWNSLRWKHIYIVSVSIAVGSRQNKTRSFENMVISYFKQDLIVKLEASTLQADRRELTSSVLMGFLLIALLFLKQWVAFITFVPVNSCVHLSLRKVWNVALREEYSMNWDKTIYRRKVSPPLKCGDVSGGDFTRQPLVLVFYIQQKFTSENICLTGDQLHNTNS